MQIYELINPSDAYTFTAPSLEVAAVVTLIVGRGRYGARCVSGELQEVPMFLFGGSEAWVQETLNYKTLDSLVEKYMQEKQTLAASLESFMIGDSNNRKLYEDGLALLETEEKRKAWRDRWQDENRSSMNDIGGYAHRLADRIRKS
jgi:hypothetical protein